jgi:hypothetical protein
LDNDGNVANAGHQVPVKAGDRVQRAGDVYECKAGSIQLVVVLQMLGVMSVHVLDHLYQEHHCLLSQSVQIDMFSRYGYITIATNDTTSAYDSVNVTIDRVST